MPFYFINLLPTSFLNLSILLREGGKERANWDGWMDGGREGGRKGEGERERDSNPGPVSLGTTMHVQKCT